MPARLPPFHPVANAFHALALQRHAYYLDLLQSGRWKRYFNQQEFAELLRDVMIVTKFWNEIANKEAEPAELSIRPAA
jgi:hypothetical protein